MLKRVLFLSIATTGIFWFFLSCENPFTNNMGAKVDIAAPIVIPEDPLPKEMTFLKGNHVVFMGTASAYRDIRSVEVKVHTLQKNGASMDWTTVGDFSKESDTTARWSYAVDTTRYNDGAFVIQFRGRDPNLSGQTGLMTYMIKNHAPNVTLAAPPPNYTNSPTSPGSLRIESSIRGSIDDVRGIKPGYPQIKIWQGSTEPADEDTDYGYATLFLVGIDKYNEKDTNDKWLEPIYANRQERPRITYARFEFPLYEFELVQSAYDPDIREIRYKTDVMGNRIAYPANVQLNFRIKTSEAFFDETTYRPIPPPAGETEAVGYFPPFRWGESDEDSSIWRDEPASVRLDSTEGPVVIRIDNDDVTSTVLQTHPHKYIVDGIINRKIHRPTTGQDEFRFRILGKHSDTISHAELMYYHPVHGSDQLNWDADKGGATGELKSTMGLNEGTVFTYTYRSGGTGGKVLLPSTEPYTLTATVYSLSGSDATFSREVYIDDSGPVVRLESVRGYFSEPTSVPYTSTTDKARNDNPYVVNGNVHFAVSFYDSIAPLNYPGPDAGVAPPQGVGNYPMVKWVVENKDPGDSTSILKKIEGFQTSLDKNDLSFFENIGDVDPAYTSGWVTPPASNPQFPEDKFWSFRFNTRNEVTPGENFWHSPARPNITPEEPDDPGKLLWLYVIAQDDARNLGYVLQKIWVNDDKDKPALEIQGLFNDTIDEESKLDVTFGANPPVGNGGNWPPRNVLGQDQGIPLSLLTDDDGINRTVADVEIRLYDLNHRNPPNNGQPLNIGLIRETLTTGNVGNSDISKEWRGTLSQSIMARALYGTGTANSAHLPDGLCKLEITITDHVGSKVSIDRTPSRPGDVPKEEKQEQAYYFAVFTRPLEITFSDETPRENMQVNDTMRQFISGTVKSQLDIRHLSITFTPNVLTNSPLDTITRILTPGSASFTLKHSPVVPTLPATDKDYYYYIYDWDILEINPAGINFAPDWLPGSGNRKFTVNAYDRLGYMSPESRTVIVDTTPPVVNLPSSSFNSNRSGDVVYGKVRFSISAYDASSNLYYNEANPRPAIRWWVLPDPLPSNWNPTQVVSGPSGQFFRDEIVGGRYSAVFDTTGLVPRGSPPGNYALYVIAEDNAGNLNVTKNGGNYDYTDPSLFRKMAFTIDQNADYPTMDDYNIEPKDGSILAQSDLVIKGTVKDSDLFDSGANKFSESGNNNYVRIRFPTDAAVPPTSWGAWVGVWGELDSMGRINYRFAVDDYIAATTPDPNRAYVKAYFDNPATQKHYQIQVWDEPVATGIDSSTFKGSGGNYGKNPDGGSSIAAVSTIHPWARSPVTEEYMRNPDGTYVSGYYTFTLDNYPPVIQFANNDPDEDRPRPTFQKASDLFDALKGTLQNPNHVVEANLELLTFSYGSTTMYLYGGSTPPASPVVTPHPTLAETWNWTLTPPAETLVKDIFDDPVLGPEGPQSITLEARDIAGKRTSVVWLFYKDTQGPSIVPGIITAIPTSNYNTLTTASFPANWPLDWPHGTNWQNDSTWTTFRSTYGLDNWPSELLFTYTNDFSSTRDEKLDKIIEELRKNHERTEAPSVVSDVKGNAAVISGRFADEYSLLNLAGEFQYRFNDSGGRLGPDTWHTASLKTLSPDQKSATWEITVVEDKVYNPYLNGVDGLNTLDIRVQDTAGNWSEMYGLQFVLDSDNPYFISQAPGLYPNHNESDGFEISPTVHTKQYPIETERVFSANSTKNTGLTYTTEIFTLKGAVHDHNLKELTVIISQENPGLYPNFSLKISHDVTKAISPTNPTYEFTNAEYPDTKRDRLRVTRINASLYYWELDILEKDIADLRRTNTPPADWLLPNPPPNPNEGVRRYVTVNATDLAGRRARSQPIAWNFYLDATPPTIQYYVPAAPPNFSVFDPTVGGSFELSGIVEDKTKIRNVQYSIAKWNYAYDNGNGTYGRWFWYNTANNTWTLPSQPDPLNGYGGAGWPSAIPYPGDSVMASNTVKWEIKQGSLPSNMYPASFEEGQYKVDLYVTDWSSGGGNPANTMSVDPTVNDANTTGARKFFVDAAPPEIKWVKADNWSTTDDKRYFKNDSSGRAEFRFTVTDLGNGIPLENIEAAVYNAAGTEPPLVPWFAIATTPPSATNSSVVEITTATLNNLFNREVIVRPNMTVNLANGTGAPGLDEAGGVPLTYTLRLKVRDSAGVEATISNTRQFTLDNRPPDLPSITPVTIRAANEFNTIYGGVTIRGNAMDNSGLISKVAFYVESVSNGFTPPPLGTWDSTLNGWVGHGNSDGTGGSWIYDTGEPGDPSRIYHQATQTTLMEIDRGTFTWVVTIDNTRNFKTDDFGEHYIKGGWTTVQTAGVGDFYDTNGLLKPDEEIGLVKIYFLAMDAAGNTIIKPMDYWVYPEGDRPVITAVNNPSQQAIEAERLLNGNIRVSGLARDNERVHRVWFRVLNDNVGEAGYGTPYTLQIPEWNETTWAELNTYQSSPKNGDEMVAGAYTYPIGRPTAAEAGHLGTGWYMANRGGTTNTSASWWVYINRQGELNRLSGTGPNKIKIEVRVQDATWNEAANNWVYNSSMLSRIREPVDGSIGVGTVTAFVVDGAPTFVDERVAVLTTSPYDHPSLSSPQWGGIFETSIRKRGAYRVIVKDNVGVSQIRWTPTKFENGAFKQDPDAGIINILDPPSSYIYANELAAVNAGTPNTRGMALKAEPYPDYLLSGGSQTLTSGQTYIVWEWDNAMNSAAFGSPGNSDQPNYMRFTVIEGTGQTVTLGTAGKLIRRGPDQLYWWLVTIDVNTTTLAAQMSAGSQFGKQYEVYLSASDASRPTALTSTRTALLPLDTSPPYAEYTLNRRPAGLAQAIGGTAGDRSPGTGTTVGDISKVVLWFSRLDDGTPRAREFVSWRENAVTISGINLPAVAGFQQYNGSTDANKWFDEIDFATPLPSGIKVPFIPPEGDSSWTGNYAIVIDRNNPSVGTWHHGHYFPMGFSTGGMGKVWYVEINSLGLTSGPVTMHYVVIDTAGNARYYEAPLIVMNDAPFIKQIQLGTDIRGGATGFPTNANVKWANDTMPADGTAPLDRIRNQMLVPGTSTPLPDVQNGISDPIPATALTVNNIIDFNVRNNLMALRMETTATPGVNKTRNFRLEYVYGATPITDITNVKAGKVYIVDSEPGNTTASLGGLGATGDGPWERGYAFLAVVNGTWNVSEMGPPPTMRLWELNSLSAVPSTNLTLADAHYTTGQRTSADTAEFAYASTAFGSNVGTRIIDWAGSEDWPVPANSPSPTVERDHSLFILRVFDGMYEDIFSDFALIRIRVNNNDKTPPFAQLYDINPNTEGQARYQTEKVSLAPMSIGGNRTRGGLWNTSDEDNYRHVVKPGHIEPRRIDLYSTWRHSLSPQEMGGIAGYSSRPDNTGQTVNFNAFFDRDTVSGEVILRGYVEDDQRIGQVQLQFGTDAAVTILDYVTAPAPASGGNPNDGEPPITGLLRVPTAQIVNGVPKVYYHDTIDLYRHRVEWAYKWDTQTQPANTVVGNNVSVRVIAYNRNSTPAASPQASAPGTAHAETGPSYRINNPGFPVGLYKYNQIAFDLRPYITGFKRNKNEFFHDTRSLQGRYPLSREEVVVVTGFNLSRDSTSTTTASDNARLYLPTANNLSTRAPTAGEVTNYELDSALHYRYRVLTIPAAATTTVRTGTGNNEVITNNGIVAFRVNTTFDAVNTKGAFGNNTIGERPLLNASGGTTGTLNTHWVQPWNRESSEAIAGSDLWEDFTAVHIWQSNDTAPTNTTTNNAYFRSQGDDWVILNPAMSIDPANGRLYEAHGEGGTTLDRGQIKVSTNYQQGGLSLSMLDHDNTNVAGRPRTVMSFIDPIIQPDIYRSPGQGNLAAATWVTSSIIGRNGTDQGWVNLGGIYIKGPNVGGATVAFSGGFNTTGDGITNNYYHGESTWYNASSQTTNGANQATPPSTNQFMNPHIVTSYSGTGNNTQEHIHVSYYDSKDGSIKYRYNLRGSTNAIDATAAKTWINLDGGFDLEDAATTYTLTQANNNTQVNATYNYVRNTYVTDGQWIPAGTTRVYTVGPQGRGTGGNTTDIYATGPGYIAGVQQPTTAGNYAQLSNNYAAASGGDAFTISTGLRVVNFDERRQGTANIKDRTSVRDTGLPDVGEHNAIAITSEGYPVIAYYDASSQRLRMAVSNSATPTAATNWAVLKDVIADDLIGFGTGQFVSMRIDRTGTAQTTQNRVHMAALNSTTNQLVYIRGKITIPTTGWPGSTVQNAAGSNILTIDTVKVIDSVGTVGRWSTISLDANGDPWIAYMDEANNGSKDGVKLAYYNSGFTKELNDPYGNDIKGWETMHVPARYRVENQIIEGRENGRLGLENFPTRNVTTAATEFWSGAVSYLGNNGTSIRYRIAYYAR